MIRSSFYDNLKKSHYRLRRLEKDGDGRRKFGEKRVLIPREREIDTEIQMDKKREKQTDIEGQRRAETGIDRQRPTDKEKGRSSQGRN